MNSLEPKSGLSAGSDCDCCQGIQVVTPRVIANRPGLSALQYRIGNQSDFLSSMLARLSTYCDRPFVGCFGPSSTTSLRDRLTVRDPSDPAIALLDGWACVADLITFYQERLANEAFLRTATERLSLHEISRLVGYRPRPGLSAAVQLAFEVDDKAEEVVIPKQTACKSIPRPGTDEKQETFETTADVTARPEWNGITLRMTRPVLLDEYWSNEIRQLTFKGTGLRISSNDLLAIDFDRQKDVVIRRVLSVREESREQRTVVELELESTTIGSIVDALQKARERYDVALTTEVSTDRLGNASLWVRELPLADRLRGELRTTIDGYRRGDLRSSLIEIDDKISRDVAAILDEAKKFDAAAFAFQDQLPRLFDITTINKDFTDAVRSRLERHQLGDQLSKDVGEKFTDSTTPWEELADIRHVVFKAVAPGATKIAIGIPRDPPSASIVGRGFDNLILRIDGASPPELMATIEILDGGASKLSLTDPNFACTPATAAKQFVIARKDAGSVVDTSTLEAALKLLQWEAGAEPSEVLLTVHSSDTPATVYAVTTRRMARQTTPLFLKTRGVIAIAPDQRPFELKEILRERTSSSAVRSLSCRLTYFGGTLSTPDGFGTEFQLQPDSGTGRHGSVFTFKVASGGTTTFNDFISALAKIRAQQTEPIAWILVEFYSTPDLSGPIEATLFHEVLEPAETLGLTDGDLLEKVGAAITKLWTGDSADISAELDRYERRVWPGKALSNAAEQRSDDVTELLAELAAPTQSDNALFNTVAQIQEKTSWRTNVGDNVWEKRSDITRLAIDAIARSSHQRMIDGAQNHLAPSYVSHEDLKKTAANLLQAANTLPPVDTDRSIGSPLWGLKRASQSLPSLQAQFSLTAIDLKNLIDWVKGQPEGEANEVKSALMDRRMDAIAQVRKIGQALLDQLQADESTPGKAARVLVSALLERIPEESGTSFSLGRIADELLELLNGTPSAPGGLRALKGAASRDSLPHSAISSAIAKFEQRLAPLLAKQRFAGTSIDVTLPAALQRLQALSRTVSESERSSLLSELAGMLRSSSDLTMQLIGSVNPDERALLFAVLRGMKVGEPQVEEPLVYILRSRSSLFGWNAPEAVPDLDDPTQIKPNKLHVEDEHEGPKHLYLDGEFTKTIAGPAIAVVLGEDLPGTFSPPNSLKIPTGKWLDPAGYRVSEVQHGLRNAYRMKGTATRIELSTAWIENPFWQFKEPDSYVPNDPEAPTTPWVRQILSSTRVYCDAEKLTLGEVDVVPPAGQPAQFTVPGFECNRFLPGLEVGRPVTIKGRVAIGEFDGAPEVSEFARILTVDHRIESQLYGDTYHTVITFDRPLRYDYQRATVMIRANVVEATHGETRREILGNGDGTREFQTLRLRAQPLTFLSTPTVEGSQTTLELRVNDVRWKESKSLDDAASDAREYLTTNDNSGTVSVTSGDGTNGARFPTGTENVRATYRVGLGRGGNVGADQIRQVLGAPLGVKGVVNPLPARGGADRDTADEIRDRTPLAVLTMERLVSAQDYADFALNYAGIGKASARFLQGAVHVTVAGVDSAPMDDQTPQFRNLRQALKQFGDPLQRFVLHDRSLALLVLWAFVRIDPDRQWEVVEREIRSALFSRFSYESANLGQDVLLSDAILAIQNVEGVTYVDIDVFDAVNEVEGVTAVPSSDAADPDTSQSAPQGKLTGLTQQARRRKPHPRIHVGLARRINGRIHPAELCFLTPDIPNTLILEPIP